MALSREITLTIDNYNITLDKEIKIYEYDAINLCFTIQECGIVMRDGKAHNRVMPVVALKAYMLIETPQGTDSVEATNIVRNKIMFSLGNKYSRFVGTGKMQIILKDFDGCRITLPEFNYEVKQSINTGWDDGSFDVLITEKEDIVITDELGRPVETTKISEMDETDEITPQTYTMVINEDGNKKIKLDTMMESISEMIEFDVEEIDRRIDEMIDVYDDEEIEVEFPSLHNDVERIKSEINEIGESLDNKANKNEVFSMANMGQDIKEAMTGGSVAIVGKNTILNENIVDNQITNNKLRDENFVCVYNDFENLSSNTDAIGNWCNNFVYEKGFVKSIKVKINGEITQQGKIYLYEKLENGNIIYRKEYDINGVGHVIIPVNENIEYDFMLSTKCLNVGYAYLEIGVKSADLGGTTTEFSPNFNENYIFSIGVNYDGIVNRLKKVEETTNKLNINNLRYSKLNYCALGDSITKGENSLDNYNPMIGQRYTDLAMDYFNFNKVTNLGKGGSRITRHTQDGDSKYGMIDRLDTIPYDTDILCIFGGTNDFGNNVKIGTIDSYDYTNFKFCVNEIIKTILSHYPNIKMYFITPIHRNDWLADNIPNAVGHTLKDYVDTIKEVCEMYGIPVLDLWSIYGISPFIESQRSMFMPDGLHPIPLGMKRLADLNNKFIENMF